ncbi:MAG: hypothetical protein R3F48_16965 [Candidatus Zixiibacteriota bacterium]
MKIRDIILVAAGILLLLSASPAQGSDIEGKVRAAETDIKVFCLAKSIDQIQWSALLHLNKRDGAEIYIGLIQPSQAFGCEAYSSKDGQFRVATLGRPMEGTFADFADSISDCLFNGGYPDIAIFAAENSSDSAEIAAILEAMQTAARRDVIALTGLERVYYFGASGAAADVVLNDAELFREYKDRADEIAKSIPILGSVAYMPQRFRWYYDVNAAGTSGRTDFLSGIDSFRLPEIISNLTIDGPERKNLLDRLNRFRSYIRASYSPRLGAAEKLRLILSAYAEITRLIQMIQSGTGNLADTRVLYRAQMIKYKTSQAVSEAVGIDWSGNLVVQDTPFGKSGKLNLELDLSGPLPVELSFFKFHPKNARPIIIDSISTVIQPHQKLFRKYPISLAQVNMAEAESDSGAFSVELVIEGLSMDLFVSHAETGNEDITVEWLPGYAILAPFKEGDITSLAQTFDWQLKITKPYDMDFQGRLEMDIPDAIVVGSYKKDIEIPAGVTTEYRDIYLAAGRSIGYDVEKVTARLSQNGKTIASTTADVRIVRTQVPETRDIAFIPDESGKLEDFLRMANVSFKPFTKHSLVRASLEAYDLIIIGEDAAEYYGVLRSVNSRLRQFVNNGGDVLILGQSFGWPQDIFSFPVYSSKNSGPVAAKVKDGNHTTLTVPYKIKTDQLLAGLPKDKPSWSALIDDGVQIISAGEHGSYLQVSTIGDGRIIYCGLPLLDMAAGLDIEAIHLLTNLLNFGYGNK